MSNAIGRLPHHHLEGQRFTRLIVIGEAPRFHHAHRQWLCRCDCGKKSVVQQGNLLRGLVKSCGCLRSPPLLERFWNLVDRRGSDECWAWMGKTEKTGYGRFALTHKKLVPAHRFAYELEFGLILFPDLQVCHRCDNPPCVNARAHHFLGTARTNMADAVRKGRIAHGSRNGNTILTVEQVLRIRALTIIHSFVEIADQFEVTPETISNIYHRRTWKRV